MLPSTFRYSRLHVAVRTRVGLLKCCVLQSHLQVFAKRHRATAKFATANRRNADLDGQLGVVVWLRDSLDCDRTHAEYGEGPATNKC